MSNNNSNPSATPVAPSEPASTPTPAPISSPAVSTPNAVSTPSQQQSPSTPANVPSSAAPPASSAPPPSRAPSAAVTSVVTAPTAPVSTQVITSLVTPSPSFPGQSLTPVTILVTQGIGSVASVASSAASGVASSTTAPGLADPKAAKSQGGLSSGGRTAIAVVVPVVVVALLVLGGIMLWRRRKQNKHAEEARRKEVEEYSYNPNNDPTLPPVVGMHSEMAEDQSGYRGWGNTAASSNRKTSTNLGSGMAYSDSTSNPGGYQRESPSSPTQGSVDPLMAGRRETMDSDGIGALGAAPIASQNQQGMHRGPSNASSRYSAADHSDHSGEYPLPMNNPQDHYDHGGYYNQPGPYEQGTYASRQPQPPPIIRDVSARRNTRIENPSVFPQQGNSGIAQNF